MTQHYFTNNEDSNRNMLQNEGTTPLISTELDSVRAYQWELEFWGPMAVLVGADTVGVTKPFTLAAKQVNGIGMSVEDIEVNRVNDKAYFPGRPSMEELTVTFDNLQHAKIDKLLYELFGFTYDPRTGTLYNALAGTASNTPWTSNNNKYEVRVKHLRPSGQIRNIVRLMGAYPKSITHGEYNYSTNDFHTIEMKFRYDWFVNTYDSTGDINTVPALAGA